MDELETRAADEMFCTSCGAIIKKEAVMCIKCGVPTKKQQSEIKSKTSAILLAVFLGFWAWLYTYKKDAWKFWLNLLLSIISLYIWSVIAWIWAIIDTAAKNDDWYAQYPNA